MPQPTETADARGFAPAAERNKEPILAVLRRVLPEGGTVLEVASGTGQHVVHFARHLPDRRWQPSEIDPEGRASIAAWIAESGVPNVRAPLALDVLDEPWPVGRVDAVYNANLIHIAPWETGLALLRGAGRHLEPGGVLVLYGPYRIDGAHTAESNRAFDESLRGRDPRWGVRDLEAVCEAALHAGLRFEERVAMPANNQTLVFRREG